jgi:hypothetical protein
MTIGEDREPQKIELSVSPIRAAGEWKQAAPLLELNLTNVRRIPCSGRTIYCYGPVVPGGGIGYCYGPVVPGVLGLVLVVLIVLMLMGRF